MEQRTFDREGICEWVFVEGYPLRVQVEYKEPRNAFAVGRIAHEMDRPTAGGDTFADRSGKPTAIGLLRLAVVADSFARFDRLIEQGDDSLLLLLPVKVSWRKGPGE